MFEYTSIREFTRAAFIAVALLGGLADGAVAAEVKIEPIRIADMKAVFGRVESRDDRPGAGPYQAAHSSSGAASTKASPCQRRGRSVALVRVIEKLALAAAGRRRPDSRRSKPNSPDGPHGTGAGAGACRARDHDPAKSGRSTADAEPMSLSSRSMPRRQRPRRHRAAGDARVEVLALTQGRTGPLGSGRRSAAVVMSGETIARIAVGWLLTCALAACRSGMPTRIQRPATPLPGRPMRAGLDGRRRRPFDSARDADRASGEGLSRSSKAGASSRMSRSRGLGDFFVGERVRRSGFQIDRAQGACRAAGRGHDLRNGHRLR